MSRKEMVVIPNVQWESATSDRLSQEAEKLVRKTALECCSGHPVSIDYLGLPLEAFEVDLKKFVLAMSDCIVLN